MMRRIILILILILSFLPIGIMLFGKYAPSSNIERKAAKLSKEGMLMLESGKYEEAEKRFKEAKRIDPDDTEHINNLALVHELLERKKDALHEYKEAENLSKSELQGVIAQRGIKRLELEVKRIK